MKARNGQKKAPADRRKRQKTPKSSFLAKNKKKNACGKPPAEENCPFPRETLFGPKKKRLRQAANRGKWSCSWRSASRQKFKQKSRKKGGGTHDLAILRSESHENCFVRINFSRRIILKPLKKYLVTKKETLTFYEKSPLFLPKKRQKNTKIVTKWSSMGRNRTATLPKWSEKQDLQESDRVIAPKPLKWGFKNDFVDRFFSQFFQKIAEIK